MTLATAPRTADDVMTRELLTVPETMTAGELARFFTEHEISAAPVVDAHGAAVGVVSTFDLARLAGEGVEASGAASERFYRTTEDDEEMLRELYGIAGPAAVREAGAEDTPVGGFMTPAVQSVVASTPLAEVAKLMVAGHYHRIFVHDDGGLIGVVTSMDLLGAMAEEAG